MHLCPPPPPRRRRLAHLVCPLADRSVHTRAAEGADHRIRRAAAAAAGARLLLLGRQRRLRLAINHCGCAPTSDGG